MASLKRQPGCRCCGGKCIWLSKTWIGGGCPTTDCGDGTESQIDRLEFTASVPSYFFFWVEYSTVWLRYSIEGLNAINGTHIYTRDTDDLIAEMGDTGCGFALVEQTAAIATVTIEEFDKTGGIGSCPVFPANSSATYPNMAVRLVSLINDANSVFVEIGETADPGYYKLHFRTPQINPEAYLNDPCGVTDVGFAAGGLGFNTNGTDKSDSCAGDVGNTEWMFGSTVEAIPYTPADGVQEYDDPGDSRLALSGGAHYSSWGKEIVLPPGGKLRSTQGNPFVEHGAVAIKIRTELPDTSSGSGPWGPHVRVFFESDAAEQNYRFVDMSYTEYDEFLFVGWWKFEMGVVVAGSETIEHYEYIPVATNSSDQTWEPWIQLTRATCFGADDPTGCYDGYRLSVSLSDAGPPLYLNYHDGIQLARVLTDPPGTHFGIRRLDANDDTVAVGAVIAGKSSTEVDPQNQCLFDATARRAACEEDLLFLAEPLVDNQWGPGPIHQSNRYLLLGGEDAEGIRTYAYDLVDPGHTHTSGEHFAHKWRNLDFKLEIDGAADALKVYANVRETVEKHTPTGFGGFTVTSAGHTTYTWNVEIPLDGDDAILCDGAEFEFLAADAVTSQVGLPPMFLERILWTLTPQ